MNDQVKFYKKDKDRGDDFVVKTDKEKKRPYSLNNILIYLGIAVVMVILFLAAWLNFSKRPVSSSQTGFQYIEVKSGDNTLQIAKQLKDANLIRSDLTFWFVVKFSMSSTLQAGNYKLSSSMNMDQIIEKINKGEVDAVTVTIPEGWRTLQIARLIGEKAKIDPNVFIEAATGKEGTLFPDTYVFPLNIESSTMIRKMQDNYEKRTAALKPTSEQLILASIVEREAKNDSERAKIAAVYKNRADSNMLFQADPTIRYALDTQTYLKNKSLDFTFWTTITREDYQNLISGFNTYKNKGYPPAPICNPGLKSIEAAVNPEPNFDYFYFFHDRNDNVQFSKTYPEQLQKITQFGVSGE